MYRFGDKVVVEKNLIGTVVKQRRAVFGANVLTVYDVYVQIYDGIKTYTEREVRIYRPPYESLGITHTTPEE